MSIIHKKVTPLVLAANQANSEKSTGPKTHLGKKRTSRNAGKYFVFGQVTAERMRELGEDPTEFEKLCQALRSEIEPRGGFEEILVEEMAVNRWRLARLRRAEMGMLVGRRVKWELHVRHPEFAADEGMDGLMMHYRGLAGVTDTPNKYRQICELLESLKEKVEREGFTEEGMKTLEALYGQSPTVEGAELIRQFKDGMQASGAAIGEKVTASEDEENGEKEEGKGSRQGFLTSLSQEVKVCTAKYAVQLGLKTLAIPESTYEQLLVLPEKDSDRMLRYDAALQKDFERLQNQLVSWRSRRMEPPKR